MSSDDGEKPVSFSDENNLMFLGKDGKSVSIQIPQRTRVDHLLKHSPWLTFGAVPTPCQLKRYLEKCPEKFFEKTKKLKQTVKEDSSAFRRDFKVEQRQGRMFDDQRFVFECSLEQMEKQVAATVAFVAGERREEAAAMAVVEGQMSFSLPRALVLGTWQLERETLFPKSYVLFPEMGLEASQFVNPDDLSLLEEVQDALSATAMPCLSYHLPAEGPNGFVPYSFDKAFLRQVIKDLIG